MTAMLTSLRFKNLSFLLAWFGLVTFTGCSVMSIPTPDSLNAKIAVAYASVTQIRTTAAQLLAAGKITPDDAQNVLDQTNHARAGIDLARQLAASDLKGADTKLETVRVILLELTQYLDRKKGPPS